MWGRGPALYKHNYLKKNNLCRSIKWKREEIIPRESVMALQGETIW